MELAGSFFNNWAHQVPKQQEEYSFINIGKEQFHAAAVALIDSLVDMQRGNDAALKKILERFYQNFPKYVNNQPYVTLSERMKTLLNSSRKSELVECMAYVLRQLTIDELYAEPLKYREVFAGLTKDTKKDYLRDPKIKLPPSALSALAQALGISITLSFKEQGMELRKREVYAGIDLSTANPINLTIQIQHTEEYFPGVKNKAYFAYVGQLAVSAPKPVDNSKEQTDTLADIIALIADDNKQLLHSYDQWRKTFLSMVGDGELNYEKLKELYITFLPVQSANTLSLAMLEHSERTPVIASFTAGQERQVIELLISSIAGWICTHQIEADKIFDKLENQPAFVTSRQR